MKPAISNLTSNAEEVKTDYTEVYAWGSIFGFKTNKKMIRLDSLEFHRKELEKAIINPNFAVLISLSKV